MHGLLNNVEVRVVGDPVAAGASIDGNSSIIDMDEYESVQFIAPITDSVATGVATLTLEENDANSDTGMAAISGSAVTTTSGTNDDLNGLALISEVYHPSKRYVQAVRTSGTASIAYGPVVALLTPRQKPVVQDASVAASALVAN